MDRQAVLDFSKFFGWASWFSFLLAYPENIPLCIANGIMMIGAVIVVGVLSFKEAEDALKD